MVEQPDERPSRGIFESEYDAIIIGACYRARSLRPEQSRWLRLGNEPFPTERR